MNISGSEYYPERLSQLGSKSKDVLGYSPKATLKGYRRSFLQNARFEKIYETLIQELAKYNIHIINEKQLNQEQSEFVRNYFHSEVR